MESLLDRCARCLYEVDEPPFPWSQCIGEDRSYYTSLAEVILDTVVDYLREQDADHGALTAAADFISLQSEQARQMRLAR